MRIAHVSITPLMAVLLFGCAGHGVLPSANRATLAHSADTRTGPHTGTVQHIVVIVQENRTVDNLFNGFPGADTVRAGRTSDGNLVTLTKRRLWQTSDPAHGHIGYVRAYDNGKMDGFDRLQNTPGRIPLFSYSYTSPADVTSYWAFAKGYTFSDRMFQSNTGPSFPSHLYLIAGQSPYAAENPEASVWGCDSPSGTTVNALDQNGNEYVYGFPCFDFKTLADEMDTGGVTWRYYTPRNTDQWSIFDAISHIRYGSDWTNNIYSATRYTPAADFASGNMANVTWVVPDGFNSDHPNAVGDHGPDWVASLVNAIGQGPDWNSTVIFIVWDDWGGWYDHVKPQTLDFMGLGMRVPLIIVSPYARRGYVSHVDHEFGSILKFTEETFGLSALSASDSRADDFRDCFVFGKTPTKFRPVAAHPTTTYTVDTIVSAVQPDSE